MTGSPPIALLERSPGDVFARVRGRDIRADTFLAHVHDLVARLPDADHVLNLVQDRYRFTVAFTAIAAAGRCNVLPPNPKPAVQAELAQRFERVAVLHDGVEVAPGLPSLRYAAPEDGGGTEVPVREASDVVAVSFTSGSTGQAAPIAKTLGMFRGAIALYEKTLLPPGAQLVATVPAQHMYGLELASLMPLWAAVTTTPGKPLFPADVLTGLRDIPGPRVLITTPLHLRALLDSGLSFPALERLLCATAPLEEGLARRAEDRLGAPVIDVYGCSEAGCMARRRPALDEPLTALPGLVFHREDDATVVDGPHLDEPVPLADRLDWLGEGRFRLAGRIGDLINVAGKRGSLGDITRRLLAVPGVEDGVVFAPPDEADNRRPAAIYQGPATRREIRRHLARSLDEAFIPRPMIQVERLPRTDTSKLPRQELLRLWRQYRQGR